VAPRRVVAASDWALRPGLLRGAMPDLTRREAFATGSLALAGAAAGPLPAHAAPAATGVTVHADRVVGDLPKFWRSTGFTPAELLLLPEMRQALTFLGAIPNRGLEFVRVHYLLNLVTGAKGRAGITYDWSLLDDALDALVERGLRPVFELMGNPSDIFHDFESPDQLHAWRDLVAELAARCIRRYGREEVRAWTFETWNEPDLPFWRWGERGLLNHFDACRAGLDAADPSLRLGGPATARTLSPTFKAFLAHCDGGMCALTGQLAGRLDFVSVHEKGAPAHDEDLTPRPLAMIQRELLAVAYLRENHPRLAGLPFVNDEADPQLGWQTPHTWRALPYYAALITKIADQHQRLLADAHKVATEITNDHGFLGGWGQRTLFAYFGPRAFPHAQADHRSDLTAARAAAASPEPFDLVKKPALAAMEFLGLLGPKRCALAPESALDPDGDGLGLLATRWAEDRVAILVYNSVDRIWASGERHLTLALRGLPPGQYALAAFRIDDARACAFHLWDAWGAPNRPTADQFAALRAVGDASPLFPVERRAVGVEGLALELGVPLPSLTLLLAERENGRLPPVPMRVTAEVQPGLTERDPVLLHWTTGEYDGVRLYDVLFARSPDGPFEPVNARPLISSVFLHSREPGPGYYAIRTRTLSGSLSTHSKAVEVPA
jgi:L-iduronidase